MNCIYTNLLYYIYIICLLYLNYNRLSIIVNSYCSSHGSFIILEHKMDHYKTLPQLGAYSNNADENLKKGLPYMGAKLPIID